MTEPPRPTQREYWNGKVGEEWANHADAMDRMLAPLTHAAFDALALKVGERVLDIGCGAGATTLTAAEEVGPAGVATGVDISQPLLALARERAKAKANVHFIDGDAGVAQIAAAPFDAIFSRFGVMFFGDNEAAFARLRENLTPGGSMTFVCWRAFDENIWASAPLAALAPLLSEPVAPPDPNAPGPFALADRSKIERILTASGWRSVSIAPWDGALAVGGGGDAQSAAKFLLKIGPCARAVADQEVDRDAAIGVLSEFLAKHQSGAGVMLPAACWIVTATR